MRYKLSTFFIFICLLLTAGQANASDFLIYLAGGTSNTYVGWGNSYYSFIPQATGILHTAELNINKYLAVDQNIGSSSLWIALTDNSNNLLAVSDALQMENTFPDLPPLPAFETFTFSGDNLYNIHAGTTYKIRLRWLHFYRADNGDDSNQRYGYTQKTDSTLHTFETIYVKLMANTTNLVGFDTPTASYYITSNSFTFDYHYTLGTSAYNWVGIGYHYYPVGSLTPTQEGIFNFNELTESPAGTYNKTGTANFLLDGKYLLTGIFLYNYFGNVVASNTIPYGFEIFVSSIGYPTGNYGGGGITYTGTSSTNFYTELLPEFLSGNGITTSTAIYTNASYVVEKILAFAQGISATFKPFFNENNAIELGTEVRDGFLTVWSWFKSLDNFMGGYPYSITVLTFLFLEFAILIIKLLRIILFR